VELILPQAFNKIVNTYEMSTSTIFHYFLHLLFEPLYYGLSTRAYELRILRDVSSKRNSKDNQQGTLLVALIDNNVKLARRL
jgi:hypothetical protein